MKHGQKLADSAFWIAECIGLLSCGYILGHGTCAIRHVTDLEEMEKMVGGNLDSSDEKLSVKDYCVEAFRDFPKVIKEWANFKKRDGLN